MAVLEIVLIFSVIIFVGYFIKGMSGLAGALFSVSLLTIFFDIKFVVPIISIIDTLSGAMLFPSIRRHINRKEFIYVICGVFLGTAIGTYFLMSFASNILRMIFGLFVIVFSLKMIFEERFSFKKLKSYFGCLFGTIGGITSGMFSTNGPPIALYLGHQIRNKHILRGTMISIFLIDSIWRNSLYFVTGAFNSNVYEIALFMIPALLAATFLGSRIHLRLSEDAYRKIVGVILLIGGIILIL